MSAWITPYDEELVASARRMLRGLAEHDEVAAMLVPHGLDGAVRERGRWLVSETERAFQWEREGRAWNYLSPTPARRVAEVRYWHKDGLRRHRQGCFRAAEQELTTAGARGFVAALGHVARACSLPFYWEKRRELRRELGRARGERPAEAPPPKDTMLVELSGWYERWSLLAIQQLRHQPELAAVLGLTPGRAGLRLRSKRRA